MAPLVNGFKPAPMPSYNEVAEYNMILKLRDEVVSGLHPKLTAPAHLLQGVSPLPQLTTQAGLAVPSITPFASQTSLQRDAQKSPAVQPTPASEINPILLTKSDDLVRAETVLKRQRLEKALKEQFEQKRLDARKRPAPAEAKPDFDIPAILAKATGTTKVESAKDDGEASDSFDENSFYSSRAPDSTPERGAPSPSSAHAADGDRVADAAKARVQSAVMGAPLDADADDEYSPRLTRRDSLAYSPALDPEDEEEEGEYSPPEAIEQESAMQDVYPPMSNAQGRHLRRYSELDNGNVRIVRNHIISPVAPQPSRISPLAVAKQPPSQQNTHARRDRSPDGANPRKKRKLDKRDRNRRRNGGSPGVKEENVSPPPFHEVQPLGSARVRASNPDHPIMIEDGPRDVRYAPVDQQLNCPRPVVRYAEQIMPMSEPRVMSRQAMRPMRDNQDLRRVASMHNVRAEMGDDPAYAPVSRPRVASYRESSPVVHRQVLDDPYDRQPLEEVRVSRTPAPVYREAYPEDAHVRYEPMPPPPIERIVVDQYGRRFREIVEQRPSTSARTGSVRPEVQPDYDAYRSPRAASTFVEAPQERRYVQPDMQPPPPIYRQEIPRQSMAPPGRDVYVQPLGRSASVMPDRAPLRASDFIGDRGEFLGPARIGSVRPMPQYEDTSRESIVRATSVRPGGREAAYVSVEPTRYRVPEQPGQRYFDEHGREIIMQRF